MERDTQKRYSVPQILKPIQQGDFRVDFVFFFHSILNILLFDSFIRSTEEGTQFWNSSLEVSHNEALGKSEHLIHTLPLIFPKTAWGYIDVYI